MAGYANGGDDEENRPAAVDVCYRCEEQRGDPGAEDGDVGAVGCGRHGDVEGLRDGNEGAVDDGLREWPEKG